MTVKTLALLHYGTVLGREFTATDLSNRDQVITLFEHCGILQGFITNWGWEFLFQTYGLKGLLEIDAESVWLDDEDVGEWIVGFFYHALIVGFDPQTQEHGRYDEETAIFTNRDGEERKIDWMAIYQIKQSLGDWSA